MTAWYDENGHRVVANEYDGEGRVIQQTDAAAATVIIIAETPLQSRYRQHRERPYSLQAAQRWYRIQKVRQMPL